MDVFNSINLPKPGRSRFNLTHERNFSAQMGRIIPVFCEEVIPNDKWSVATAMKLELAPLRAPLMHNMDVYLYYFFIPNNLLSSAWDTWISQGEPADSPNIPFPFRFELSYLQDGDSKPSPLTAEQLLTYAGPSSLLDYLGFSNEFSRTGGTIPVSASLKNYSSLPVLAYNAVWLNFFRNENLNPLPTSWGSPGRFNSAYDAPQNVNLSDWRNWNFFTRNNVVVPVNLLLGDSDEDTITSTNLLTPRAVLRHANFMHDYFTASLPFTQRGPQVTLPLTGSAVLQGEAVVQNSEPIQFSNFKLRDGGNPILFQTNNPLPSDGLGDYDTRNKGYKGTKSTTMSLENTDCVVDGIDASGTGSTGSQFNLPPQSVDTDNLTVDLSQVTGLSIIDLRRLSKLQQWLEKNAIGGNNPGENIYNHFGVRPSNCSLDKPQFLGGGRIPVVISNVLQTSQSTETSPQASPSGYARSQGFSGFRNKKFKDYGFILGVTYVMPRSKYMQGTRRYWDRSSRFDYFWMEFERIGEQPVYNYEIFDDGTTGVNEEEFGYNPRYSDYKYIPSSVHGDFKTSLSFWHAARIFSTRPKLNSTFLHLGKDIERIYSVDESVSTQQLWFWIRHQVKVRRPMLKNPISLLG